MAPSSRRSLIYLLRKDSLCSCTAPIRFAAFSLHAHRHVAGMLAASGSIQPLLRSQPYQAMKIYICLLISHIGYENSRDNQPRTGPPRELPSILGAIAAKCAVCMTSHTIQKSSTVGTVKLGT
jgi:hypothetical protein